MIIDSFAVHCYGHCQLLQSITTGTWKWYRCFANDWPTTLQMISTGRLLLLTYYICKYMYVHAYARICLLVCGHNNKLVRPLSAKLLEVIGRFMWTTLRICCVYAAYTRLYIAYTQRIRYGYAAVNFVYATCFRYVYSVIQCVYALRIRSYTWSTRCVYTYTLRIRSYTSCPRYLYAA